VTRSLVGSDWRAERRSAPVCRTVRIRRGSRSALAHRSHLGPWGLRRRPRQRGSASPVGEGSGARSPRGRAFWRRSAHRAARTIAALSDRVLVRPPRPRDLQAPFAHPQSLRQGAWGRPRLPRRGGCEVSERCRTAGAPASGTRVRRAADTRSTCSVGPEQLDADRSPTAAGSGAERRRLCRAAPGAHAHRRPGARAGLRHHPRDRGLARRGWSPAPPARSRGDGSAAGEMGFYGTIRTRAVASSASGTWAVSARRHPGTRLLRERSQQCSRCWARERWTHPATSTPHGRAMVATSSPTAPTAASLDRRLPGRGAGGATGWCGGWGSRPAQAQHPRRGHVLRRFVRDAPSRSMQLASWLPGSGRHARCRRQAFTWPKPPRAVTAHRREERNRSGIDADAVCRQ
jgi:hypothetical protein